MKSPGPALLSAILCLPALACAAPRPAPPPRPIVATLDTTQVSRPISPYEYGMFIEHIGSLVYRSLWSEMLDDRKFYYPISSKPAPRPAGPRHPTASASPDSPWSGGNGTRGTSI